MPKSILIETKFKLAKFKPRWKPYPWSRFSIDEFKREVPLRICPSAKCRRGKTCVDAHQGLYCQRTHFNRAEGTARVPQSDTDKHIASIPSPPASAGTELRLEHLKEIAHLRRMEAREKIKLWKAGGLKEYGPYRASGFMKPPPPRAYVEE